MSKSTNLRWDHVYNEHKQRLFTTTVYILGGYHDVAEDVVHDVFVSICRRGIAPADVGDARAFLVTACRNRARDYMRRNKRFVNSPLPELVDISGAPSELAVTLEESRRLIAAIKTLPIEQREVIALHVHGGLSFSEAAAELEISPNTAKSRYRYALNKLRQNLAQKKGTNL